MDDLIAALQIFRKYTDAKWPTHCEHDELHVMVAYDKVSSEDLDALEKLDFIKDEYGMFKSFRFGSA